MKFTIKTDDSALSKYLEEVFEYAGVKYETETDEVATQTMADLANVDDEPENIDKDFLKAQLSTKNQVKFRNVMTIISYIAIITVFILEKLGII